MDSAQRGRKDSPSKGRNALLQELAYHHGRAGRDKRIAQRTPAPRVHAHTRQADHCAHAQHDTERGVIVDPLAAFVGGEEAGVTEAEHSGKGYGEKAFHDNNYSPSDVSEVTGKTSPVNFAIIVYAATCCQASPLASSSSLCTERASA